MKEFQYYIILVFFLLLNACAPKELTVDEIIDRSVEAYGGHKVLNSQVEFDFRDKHYISKYHNYRFTLKRVFSDSTGNIVDELNNDGFTRLRDENPVSLDEEWSGKYSRSVNSVIYFFRIPFVLKDEAVNPELIGQVDFNNRSYYKVRVSFSEEGGGEDFDDSFVYWIDKQTFYIDYFAYSYSTDGGGRRFREAINPQNIDGLRVVDYINYEPQDLDVPIEDYDNYYNSGGLIELSRIENKNVTIEYLK